MRPLITLLHNPEAGFEQYSRSSLTECFSKRGFDVDYVNTKEADLDKILAKPGDAIVVGGGDGTVAKVCKRLVGSRTPIGILPLGTANNIATSLGVRGSPEEVIARLDFSDTRRFDVGMVRGPKGRSVFFESLGFGLFPNLIRSHQDDSKEEVSREAELREAIEDQIHLTKCYEANGCYLKIDGEELRGRFLMVEAMNIPLIGPNIPLAPQADPGDGMLDIVLVAEDEREALIEFLRSCLDSAREFPMINRRRAAKFEIQWEGSHYHIDDKAPRADSPVKMIVELQSGALTLLAVDTD